MKKLYEVNLDLVFYVMAKDASDVYKHACEYAEDEIKNLFDSEFSVMDAKILFANWADAIPYNSDDDKTCSQVLDEKKRQAVIAENDKKQIKIWQGGL